MSIRSDDYVNFTDDDVITDAPSSTTYLKAGSGHFPSINFLFAKANWRFTTLSFKMPRSPNIKNLSLSVKLEVVLFLSDMATCGRLPRGAISQVAMHFGCHRNTIYKVWTVRATISTQRLRNHGPPRAHTDGEIKAKIEAAPVHDRTTLRSLAASTGIPRTQLSRCLNEKNVLERITVVPKPLLTAKRCKFSRSFVNERAGEQKYQFASMHDVVHVDEKTKPSHEGYVLAAVACPRYDAEGRLTFDGKIGLWPVVETTLALRNSKNRPKGTPITTPVEMTKDIYERLLTQNAIPAVNRIWPGDKKIVDQQDNASPHRGSDRSAVKAAATADGWSITFVSQPPRSPDFNVLDLGWFRSLQALQSSKPTRDIDGLIVAVNAAFDEMLRCLLAVATTTTFHI
ncbi:hypothetical protein F441_03145 [Phytophthora nicotianae CJ01A1]|uniref:Transposase Tc1-like domain-containing protein n=1 Tax=Phytophthora nicotianae CJ01A1 TaxID=1317063 RepID=W2XMA8_PHYNI|nr:hypothetical protein F441_03145 [Phytophthora nicotianae CJ01A1]